jgi:predicted RNA binding protein YcfA (HicA-like mRNA interferase family)
LRLPRDLAGHDLAKLLRHYAYEMIRQTGSHLRLKSNLCGTDHQITIPAHKTLKVGTPNGIISAVAAYLDMDRSQLAQELFKK